MGSRHWATQLTMDRIDAEVAQKTIQRTHDERAAIANRARARAETFEDADDYGDPNIRTCNLALARQFREFAREIEA